MTPTQADPAEHLRTIGAKRIRLKTQLDEIDPQVKVAIVAAHQAGMKQREIAELTGFTRDSVYAITNPSVAEARRKAKRKGEKEN